jgi:hypothetical protein
MDSTSSEPDVQVTGEIVPVSGITEFNLFSRKGVGMIDLKTGKPQLRVRDTRSFDSPAINKQVLESKGGRTLKFTLPFLINGNVGMPLPLGLTVIIGGTAAGKSSLVRKLPSAKRYLVVEPPDNQDELDNLPMFNDIDEALLFGAFEAFNSSTLIVLDSLRAAAFETEGPAGDKGIIMPFFTSLTRVSNSLAMHGISMIATVNPLQSDPLYVKAFTEKVSSAVPAFIIVESVNQGIFTGTVADRTQRQPLPFTFDPSMNRNFDVVSETGFVVPAHVENFSLFSEIQLNSINKEQI